MDAQRHLVHLAGEVEIGGRGEDRVAAEDHEKRDRPAIHLRREIPERRELIDFFGAESGPGTGADVVFEAVGSDTAWIDAVELARPGGTVLMFGGLPADARPPIDAYRVHYEELTVRGSFHHTPSTGRAALGFLASGAYPWERLVTHRVLLDDLPALFADPPPELLKAAVVP